MLQEDLTKWAHMIAGHFVPVVGTEDLKEAAETLEDFRLLVTTEARAETALQRQLRKECSEEITPLECLVEKYAGAYDTPEATTLQVLQDLLNELQGWRNGHVLQGFQEDLTAMQMRALDAEKAADTLQEALAKALERAEYAEGLLEDYDIRPDC